MTHQEQLEKWFQDVGVSFDYHEGNQYNSILIEAMDHDKVHGYIGFGTTFNFTKEGRFVDIAIQEG